MKPYDFKFFLLEINWWMWVPPIRELRKMAIVPEWYLGQRIIFYTKNLISPNVLNFKEYGVQTAEPPGHTVQPVAKINFKNVR